LPVLLDTSIAIHLRDETAGIGDYVATLPDVMFLSVMSRIELENGIVAAPDQGPLRKAKLDLLLETVGTIDFTEDMIGVYAGIVNHLGFSRRKIIDRMIAATAISADLTLITTNGDDFADIPGLQLTVWPML
jgi:tRNA(fMet)-specific endonuclease VapC